MYVLQLLQTQCVCPIQLAIWLVNACELSKEYNKLYAEEKLVAHL